MAYTVKRGPCFFRPNRNSGTFRISRNTDSVRYFGVMSARNMAVPEMPLS